MLLVTLDGLRWQELYRGLDHALATHPDYSARSEQLLAQFWDEDPALRAAKLMPFLHDVVFAQGAHAGNRDAGSCARITSKTTPQPDAHAAYQPYVDAYVDAFDQLRPTFDRLAALRL